MKTEWIICSFMLFVLLSVAIITPDVSSADHYICVNPLTKKGSIVENPHQCLKPSTLHIISDAEFAKAFPGTATYKSRPTAMGRSRIPKVTDCKQSCTAIWVGSCVYTYCCCEDASNCEISPLYCPSGTTPK